MSPQQKQAAQLLLQRGGSRRAIRTMIWNGGGLPYHELLHWLQEEANNMDVVVVAETRLPHDLEHTNERYHVTHSSSTYAGILILISTRIGPTNRIT